MKFDWQVEAEMENGKLTFETVGAELFSGAASDYVDEILAATGGLPKDQAGVRISGVAELERLLASSGPIGKIASTKLDNGVRPVRAILFDKSPEWNWSLRWHQDRTICVQSRVDHDGFSLWTLKRGMLHVEPPAGLLERMVTLRVHLDPVPEGNGPLLIAPGSHLMGRIPISEIMPTVEKCGVLECFADRGDIWVYSTLIVHSSNAALAPSRRRVLQIDYSADDLPPGLEWAGI